ncbi:rhodanese-like domain-containing protein [Brevibacillus centrosporus]|uniref:Rhodanese-related sulfurtransferase n=1 Tax=Brevibacillus centrosporus TaxID=54910 RepID=A0A1I4BRU8_9BACL|nr:rhodanese-like domain-containing protein [Brevibacillus centrosporus]MED1954405.1 rhodanese-like domain-containing protein [Brevibacillus centrosporus]MED4908382.1 rhodanese-like domain-containing protein [Brevibacillus centrosporus]SFK70716.1 Rhodanese-related sulfurtransferase [Brevibacillus centrosporus]
MNKGWQEVTTEQVEQRLSHDPEIQLIDVRNPDEYEDDHIPGAKLIPLSELPARTNEIDHNREVIFICRSGNRSGKACEYMAQLGYSQMYNMVGGMLAWTGKRER